LWKENRALARRLRAAHLKERGVIEDVDYQHPRGLDRKLVRTLCSSDWVRQHQSILLLGPTGIGKSWLACALAQKACRDGFSVPHKRTSELFCELAVAHADGSIGRFLVRPSRIDILLLDDFAMAPLKDAERRSSVCHTGLQYWAVDSITTSWASLCINHSANECSWSGLQPHWRRSNWYPPSTATSATTTANIRL
jgi:hypothetical protein